MDTRGRVIAPGGLRDELAAGSDDEPAAGEPLAALAARLGLRPSSARPGPAPYLNMVWQRRHFILAYATARNVSMYTEARLGQVWQVLTPLLNSGAYYLIFGVLFKANRGIDNYIAYLVTGVFIFAFTERSIVVGSSAIRANITLIRALHFPRACLPLGPGGGPPGPRGVYAGAGAAPGDRRAAQHQRGVHDQDARDRAGPARRRARPARGD